MDVETEDHIHHLLGGGPPKQHQAAREHKGNQGRDVRPQRPLLIKEGLADPGDDILIQKVVIEVIDHSLNQALDLFRLPLVPLVLCVLSDLGPGPQRRLEMRPHVVACKGAHHSLMGLNQGALAGSITYVVLATAPAGKHGGHALR